jgi:hypothetical protein
MHVSFASVALGATPRRIKSEAPAISEPAERAGIYFLAFTSMVWS